MRSLFDQVKSFPKGAEHLFQWLGENGAVADKSEAQRRADICQTCPQNQAAILTEAVAMAVRKHLELKNHLALRVSGEKGLRVCNICGCSLRLQIWQPIGMVKAQLTDTEKYPDHCWKTQTT